MYYGYCQESMNLSLVRDKIERGDLPREDWEQTRTINRGFHSPCAACDTPTMPVDMAVECHQGGKRFVLHPDCFVMWDEARR